MANVGTHASATLAADAPDAASEASHYLAAGSICAVTNPDSHASDGDKQLCPPVTAMAKNPHLWAHAATIFLFTSVIRLGVLGCFALAKGIPLQELLTKWDAKHYLRIAESGYFGGPTIGDTPPEQILLAFFPGYPALVKALGYVGLPGFFAALLLSTAAGIAMAAGAMEIARRCRGGDNLEVQWGAAVLICSAPMSITFSMPYTEALFGALAVWALVQLIDENWAAAAVLVAAAGTVRFTAVDLVAVFLVWVALRAARSWRAWCWAALTMFPPAAYLWWASANSGVPGGYFELQREHWNSGFNYGAATLHFLAQTFLHPSDPGYTLSALVIVAAVGGVGVALGRAPWPVWLFAAALTLNVLLSDGIMHSRPRLLLPAVVVLIPLLPSLFRRLSPAGRWLSAWVWLLVGAVFSAYMVTIFQWAI